MRLIRFLATPFGLAALCCLALAGGALWSAGVLDGPLARTVRTSSVYVAPGVDLDRASAERVIGNRRLVVALLEPGADLRAGCDGVRRAASGTLVLMLSPADDGYETYSCALIADRDGANTGRAAAAELTIANGVDEFADRPVEALKVVVVNYDLLVRRAPSRTAPVPSARRCPATWSRPRRSSRSSSAPPWSTRELAGPGGWPRPGSGRGTRWPTTAAR